MAALRVGDQDVPDALLAHLSPLRWEHVNLTGDYRWPSDASRRDGQLRPLRRLGPMMA